MATIEVDTLCLAQMLAMSACAALQEYHEVPQLETIMTHLGIPSSAQLPQKCSYASVLVTGTQCPAPASRPNLPCPVHYDFMLSQKSWDSPVLANLTCEGNTETRPLIYRDSLRQG